MPESKRNPKTAAKARERRALEAEEHRIANETATKRSTAPSRFDNRSWVPWVFVPVMILGGLYIVVNNMAGISGSMNDLASSSRFMLELSNDLARSAERLKEEVFLFLEHARAAR